MSSSNCCFLTCVQISQEPGKVVWYSHLFKNIQEFFVVHTVKGFGIVHKAEVDIFLELFCFFSDPADVGNLVSGSFALSKPSWNIWKVMIHVLLKPGLENFERYVTNMWDECNCVVVIKQWLTNEATIWRRFLIWGTCFFWKQRPSRSSHQRRR